MTLTITVGNSSDQTNTHMREERKRHESELDKEAIWRKRRRSR